MGLGGISVPQLLIMLAIVLLVFGTKRMTSLGSDLGGAIRGFRKAMEGEDGKGSDRRTAEQQRITATQVKNKAAPSERTDDALSG